MTKTYNKLVRDRIPQIITDSGKNADIRVLDDSQYLIEVDRKLDEELSEYHQNPCLEELADLVEVVYAAVKARGYSLEQLEQQRQRKKDRRGGFEKHLFLVEVKD